MTTAAEQRDTLIGSGIFTPKNNPRVIEEIRRQKAALLAKYPQSENTVGLLPESHPVEELA